MGIALGGTNHKTSPLWLREKAALSSVGLFDTRKRLFLCRGVKEVALVSTCNRVEFYAAGNDSKKVMERLRSFLMEEYKFESGEIDKYFYFAHGEDAVRHLFTVMSGADSMVLGESQISGQIRKSFELAYKEGTLGPELERLRDAARNARSRVLGETLFGGGPVSIGSVAVDMARGQIGSLKNKSAMILGAGDMGILTARALSANGIATILVANRTLSRAQEVAHSLGGFAVDYTELSAQVEKVDILVTSTSAPHVLVRKSMVEAIMSARPKRPLFIVDLAVPRNVDAKVDEVEKVTLINVDDLQEVADKNSEERKAELGKVRDIVDQETATFMAERTRRGMSLLDLALG